MFEIGLSNRPEVILHDCAADRIETKGNKLIMYFGSGIHVKNGGDYERKKCRLIAECDFLDNEINSCMSAYVFRKDKRAELSVEKLFSLINEHGLRVYIDFYSDFASALLIKGYLNDCETEITVSDIKNLYVIYDRT